MAFLQRLSTAIVFLALVGFGESQNSTAEPNSTLIVQSTTVKTNTTVKPTTIYNLTTVTFTTASRKPEALEKQCENFEIFILENYAVNIPYTVTACIVLLCSFVLVLAGYRLFKLSLFLLGFLSASFITYVICGNHTVLPSWGLIAVSIAVGLFCGLLTMFVIYCGLFLGGFGFGFFIGVAGFFVVEIFYNISIKWIPFGVLLGLSLLFGILTLKWQKSLYILATSLIGAALLTCGVGYFIEEFLLASYAWDRIMATKSKSMCWQTWAVVGVWPVMFIIGVAIQFCVTGRNYVHRTRKDSMALQSEDSAMKRYRSLNMNGDVVAKSYYSRGDEDIGKPTEV